MIHLAFCITELNIGGAERALCELAVRLDKSRFNVTVYSLQSRPADDAASCVPLLEAAGIPVRFLDMRGPVSFLPGFFRLRRLLKTQKPDVFMSFLFHANFLGRLSARAAGIRHIVSGIRVAEREKRWHLTLDRWTSRFVETFVCVSNSVAVHLADTSALIPANKITVIPNGIDFIDTPPPSRQNRIISVGRLTHQKGLDWFLATVPEWLPKLPDWELWLVGDGEQRSSLEEMIQHPAFKSVRDRIIFTGWRPDASELVAESRLLVLPSRWEGMPNVVLQAMAAGLPVAASDVEGVTELLGPNAQAQMFPFGDVVAVSDRILTLVTDPDLADRLGTANRCRAAEQFRLETIVEKYAGLFEEMVGSRFS